MARGPQAIALHLSEHEWAELERLIRRRSAGQALVQRARIVLACGPSRAQPTRAWRVRSASAAPA
jgi:hypothetical protein